jgi:hypothetical protein
MTVDAERILQIMISMEQRKACDGDAMVANVLKSQVGKQRAACSGNFWRNVVRTRQWLWATSR